MFSYFVFIIKFECEIANFKKSGMKLLALVGVDISALLRKKATKKYTSKKSKTK